MWLPALAACYPTLTPRLGRPDTSDLEARMADSVPAPGDPVRLVGGRQTSWPAIPDLRHPTAVVLSGGGVRGAFQAGALTRLLTSDAFRDQHRIDHVFGVSVGALNAALAGLAVSRTSCPGCWPEDEAPGRDMAVDVLKKVDGYSLWRTWSAVEDYTFFQKPGRYDTVALQGFLFDLRPLRAQMDDMLGRGTLYRTGWTVPGVDPCAPGQKLGHDGNCKPALPGRPEGTEDAFAAACRDKLEWPILHVSAVPYAGGVSRSVAYDLRAEADRSCKAVGVTADPLHPEIRGRLDRCGPYQEDPESCADTGGAVCCVESSSAFADAMWASAAQPLLHNPVPLDPNLDGPPYPIRQRELYDDRHRPKLWTKHRRFWPTVGEHWPLDRGELDLAMDGGVRDVFPILEALSSGADRIIVIGNVPAQRPDCSARFAKDLGSGPDRSLSLLFRSILELTIAETYNTDLIVAREVTEDVSAHNRDRASLLADLARVVGPIDADEAWTGCDLDPRDDRSCLQAELASLDPARCGFQTRSDASLVALADRVLDGIPGSGALQRRLERLEALPAAAYDGWSSWPDAMTGLRRTKERHVAACALRVPLTGPERAALNEGRVQAGFYHVPDVWLTLPDRYPGDPLDQVHHELGVLLRDGWHRAGAMVRLDEYSAPEACVPDIWCASCGEDG